MSLEAANSYNSLGWVQQNVNPGFSPSLQNDNWLYSKSYTIDPAGVNSLYAVQNTLAPSAAVTIDLQNVVDFFNNTMIFERVYSIQFSAVAADIEIGPSGSNPVQWFFGTTTDSIVVKANSDFSYNTTYPFVVSGSAKNITLTNLSGTTTATYKIAILGGVAAPTTTTTTTTTTTSTTTTTGAPTTSTTSTTTTSTTSTTSTSTTSTTTTTGAPLTILSSSPLPSGTQGFSYVFTFSASGGLTPYQWTITSGSVPANLSLDLNTGTLGGVLAGGSAGVYSFDVTCTDAASATDTSPFSLTIV